MDLNKPCIVIPLLNEIEAFPKVFNDIPESWKKQIIIVDNGSTDGSIDWLKSSPVHFIQEKQKGYGSACFRGLEEAKKLGFTEIMFMDADGTDRPTSIEKLYDEFKKKDVDFLFSIRKNHEGHFHAKLGTAFLLFCVRLLWGHRFEDMGPMRIMKLKALEAIEMQDRSFGWTLEMQIRVLKNKNTFDEIPLSSAKRIGGASKISGTFWGTLMATKSLFYQIIKLSLN